MRSMMIVFLGTFLCLAPVAAFAGDEHDHGKEAPAASAATTCEHGVKATLCTRCNPKLESVFKSKGDWCPEHGLPESQCAKCNPGLAKQGVK